MKALKIVGIVVVSGLLLFTTLALIGAGILLARQGVDDSYGLGYFMGRLLIELILLAILTRLMKSLRTPVR
jgi:hypothetical protein